MFYKWFSKCERTAEAAKECYRDLVKKYHPDNGGTGDEIKQINAEFQAFWKEVKNFHRSEKETADGTTNKGFKYQECDINQFMEIINKLVIVPGLRIEVCGTWIWIYGNSYPFRDYLKSIGCRWSKGKKLWYWTEAEYKRGYKHPSKGEIRVMYGSTIVKSEKDKRQIAE